MAYSPVRSKALTFLRLNGVDDPTDYKMSEIAFGCGAIVVQKSLPRADGRIVFGKQNALITINQDIPTLERKRFVLAHELGHFAMHREHFQLHGDSEQTLDYFQKGPQEREANEFAAEILMPYHQFRASAANKRMGPELIRELAESFKVSLTAAAFRLLEIGYHPLMVVYSEKGRVKYFKRSEEYDLQLQNLVRLPVPLNSVAHEYFTNQARYSRSEGRQVVRKSTWFSLAEDEQDGDMYEFCIPNSWNDSVLSVIWED